MSSDTREAARLRGVFDWIGPIEDQVKQIIARLVPQVDKEVTDVLGDSAGKDDDCEDEHGGKN